MVNIQKHNKKEGLSVKLIDVNFNSSNILNFFLKENEYVSKFAFDHINDLNNDIYDDYDVYVINDYFYNVGGRDEERKEKILRFCADKKEKKIVLLSSPEEVKGMDSEHVSVRNFGVRDKHVFQKIDKHLKAFHQSKIKRPFSHFEAEFNLTKMSSVFVVAFSLLGYFLKR